MVIQVDADVTNGEKEYVRIEEAATIFGVSRQTMYDWINRYGITKYTGGPHKGVKFVKPAEIRAAREQAAQFRPIDEADSSN